MTKYESIYESMLCQLKSGQCSVGDKFLTETEASEKFSVTHVTVRKAFRMLVQNGYVKRIRKKGTFVISLTGKDMSSGSDSNEIRPLVFCIQNIMDTNRVKDIFKDFLDSRPYLDITIQERHSESEAVLHSHESHSEKIYIQTFNDVLRYRSMRLPEPMPFLQHQAIVNMDPSQIIRSPSSAVGTVLGVPIRYVNRIPMVNLSLAEKLGLNIEKLPGLWSEVGNWCKIAQERGCKTPLGPISGSLFTSYIFHCYLSAAIQADSYAAENKLLMKEPFLETVSFFKTLYHNYSSDVSIKVDKRCQRDNSLFDLFAGPWFLYENQLNNVSSKYVPLEHFIPGPEANNFMYSAPSYVGLFTETSSLTQPEKDALNDFFKFVCSDQFQKDFIFSSQSGMPSQTCHRDVQHQLINEKSDLAPFYRSNFIPLLKHDVPCFKSWYKIMPVLELFFNEEMELEVLWKKVDCLQTHSRNQLDIEL